MTRVNCLGLLQYVDFSSAGDSRPRSVHLCGGDHPGLVRSVVAHKNAWGIALVLTRNGAASAKRARKKRREHPLERPRDQFSFRSASLGRRRHDALVLSDEVGRITDTSRSSPWVGEGWRASFCWSARRPWEFEGPLAEHVSPQHGCPPLSCALCGDSDVHAFVGRGQQVVDASNTIRETKRWGGEHRLGSGSGMV